ncbi:MAG TPA: type II toxin-antitoxin system VapC family toxin [Chloroflexota bacterium]|nr:type II toxin-antitoxin system VapC family toxin [Chloroflexota bacterium]
MSDLVLDASAVIDAAADRRGFAVYGSHTLHAPALLWWEVSSVLHEKAWHGALSRAEAATALQRFLALDIRRLEPTPELLLATARVADRLSWARTYDATYLAVALSIPGSRVVTRDEAMKRGAGWLVDIIGPAEL